MTFTERKREIERAGEGGEKERNRSWKEGAKRNGEEEK